MDKILSTNAVVKRLATLDSWIEGVVWVPDDLEPIEPARYFRLRLE